MNECRIISLRENIEYIDAGISYFQKSWPDIHPMIYEDAIKHSVLSESRLPRWYLLLQREKIIGCAGLINNDFISRFDLYPWICALHIDEAHRGNAYGSLLLDMARQEAGKLGFKNLYLTTDHSGLYEKYGFRYLTEAYDISGETTHIYESPVSLTRQDAGKNLKKPSQI